MDLQLLNYQLHDRLKLHQHSNKNKNKSESAVYQKIMAILHKICILTIFYQIIGLFTVGILLLLAFFIDNQGFFLIAGIINALIFLAKFFFIEILFIFYGLQHFYGNFLKFLTRI